MKQKTDKTNKKDKTVTPQKSKSKTSIKAPYKNFGKIELNEYLDTIYNYLLSIKDDMQTPSVTMISQEIKNEPFIVLVASMASARTRDDKTLFAVKNFMQAYKTPYDVVNSTEEAVGKSISVVAFYKTKAKHIMALSKMLIEEYKGIVPKSIDELIKLPGVGRKSANLILIEAFGEPAMCVDTHVHRICNRLGLTSGVNAERTEYELRDFLPIEYWIKWNELLVSFGQNICKPINPQCNNCGLKNICKSSKSNNK